MFVFDYYRFALTSPYNGNDFRPMNFDRISQSAFSLIIPFQMLVKIRLRLNLLILLPIFFAELRVQKILRPRHDDVRIEIAVL